MHEYRAETYRQLQMNNLLDFIDVSIYIYLYIHFVCLCVFMYVRDILNNFRKSKEKNGQKID